MILLFYICLLVAIDSVFCDYEYKDMKIINSEEGFTLIDCEKNIIEKLKLPPRKLFAKDDIRIMQCKIPNNYKLSQLMDDLEINVIYLTIQLTTEYKPKNETKNLSNSNLVGLESLRHLTISKFKGKFQ